MLKFFVMNLIHGKMFYMMNNISVKIKMNGFFKKYNLEYIFLLIPYNCNIGLLRSILFDELRFINKFLIIDEVLKSSVFACKDVIVDDEYVISDKEIIVIIPPVNGG